MTRTPAPVAHASSVWRAPRTNAGTADSLSTLINIAGRQRMLSQRVVLHTVLAAQGDLAALTIAQEALELLRFSHQRLLGAPLLSQAMHGPAGAHGPVDAFVRLTEETLAAIAQSQHGIARRVSSLVARAAPVLGVLNDLTQSCEMLARAQLHAQQQRQAELLGRLNELAEALDSAAAVGDVAALPRLAAHARQLVQASETGKISGQTQPGDDTTLGTGWAAPAEPHAPIAPIAPVPLPASVAPAAPGTA